jgi:hypothetical protein
LREGSSWSDARFKFRSREKHPVRGPRQSAESRQVTHDDTIQKAKERSQGEAYVGAIFADCRPLRCAEVVVCSVHDRGKENSLGGHKKNLEVVAKSGVNARRHLGLEHNPHKIPAFCCPSPPTLVGHSLPHPSKFRATLQQQRTEPNHQITTKWPPRRELRAPPRRTSPWVPRSGRASWFLALPASSPASTIPSSTSPISGAYPAEHRAREEGSFATLCPVYILDLWSRD